MSDKIKVLEILNLYTEKLKENKIENPKVKSELIIGKVLSKNRSTLYLDFDQIVSKNEEKIIKLYIDRVLKREPIQYILGEWDFYGYNLIVNNNVLIPRPETEELVERTLNYIFKNWKFFLTNGLSILDIGTGSGAIIISLYKEIEKKNSFIPKNFKFTATDLSENSLRVAKSNGAIYKASVNWVNCSLFDKVDTEIDLLISNPPYIDIDSYNKLEPELFFEPKMALTDKSDGLTIIEEIISNVNQLKIKKSFIEIGFDQKDKISNFMKNYKNLNFKVLKDLSKNDRILEIDYGTF